MALRHADHLTGPERIVCGDLGGFHPPSHGDRDPGSVRGALVLTTTGWFSERGEEENEDMEVQPVSLTVKEKQEVRT